jgi:tripartite-type tricarboxylate transporter receptor subunit TctC
MQKAITTPDVKGRLEDFGLEVSPSSGAQFATFLDRETTFWHKLIRERKIFAE